MDRILVFGTDATLGLSYNVTEGNSGITKIRLGRPTSLWNFVSNSELIRFFYSAPQCSHCKRCTSYGNSVRLSIRLSHAGIVSKRLHVARCSLHCQIAKCVWFCRNQKVFPRDDPFSLKSWLELTYPVLIATSLDTFCLVAPQR